MDLFAGRIFPDKIPLHADCFNGFTFWFCCNAQPHQHSRECQPEGKHMGFQFWSSDRGFSLIELLTAMTVFTVGLLAVAGMQLTAIRANACANSLSAAGVLAEGVLEEILAVNGDDPLFAADRAATSWVFHDSDSSQTTKTVDGAGIFQATYAIDADYGVANLARVEVTVTSTGVRSRSQTLIGFKRRL
jgi:type IV pilus assembly protein PilV